MGSEQTLATDLICNHFAQILEAEVGEFHDGAVVAEVIDREDAVLRLKLVGQVPKQISARCEVRKMARNVPSSPVDMAVPVVARVTHDTSDTSAGGKRSSSGHCLTAKGTKLLARRNVPGRSLS